MSRRLSLGLAAGASALGLALVPAAASADGVTLYTWAYNPVGSDVGGFATTSSTDALLALLGADSLPVMDRASGVESCGGVGYGLGAVQSDLDDVPAVAIFDLSTGAITTGPTELTIADGDVEEVWEADTLADCTLLTIGFVSITDYEGLAILEVNPATGATTIVVELLDVGEDDITGLATDSAGVTYLFGEIEAFPTVRVVDLGTGTLSDPNDLAGLIAAFGGSTAFTMGVDFDQANGLWVVAGIDNEEEYHLLSFAAGADVTAATPSDIGILPYYPTPNELQVTSPIPLAAEGAVAPQPQLAATGAQPPVALAGAAGLLAIAGVALLVGLRRREA